jgi:hypothetical protein
MLKWIWMGFRFAACTSVIYQVITRICIKMFATENTEVTEYSLLTLLPLLTSLTYFHSRPLSSILKARHFFLFTFIFKKIFFNYRVKKFNFFFEKLYFSKNFFYIYKWNIQLFQKSIQLFQ